MKTQTYHCDSVEAAIRRARAELGEEAMLLDSRKLPPEERHLGAYEVRFALAGKEAPAATGIDDLSRGLDEIRRLLQTLTKGYQPSAARAGPPPPLAEWYQDLIGAEVEPEIAAELVAGLVPLMERGAAPPELEREVTDLIGALLEVSGDIGRPGSQPRLVALVGPPGVGKTTTLAKMAVQYGLGCGLSTCLVTTDNYRVAAAGQLQTFASILGVEVTAVQETRELEQILTGFRRGGPGLVLIDTPGHGFQELDQYGGELAPFLRSREDIDVHLVVSASTKSRDLQRIVDRYLDFGPRKLLFTKLDETLSLGPLLNEAVRTRLPISFLSAGQRIPEDLRPATREALAELILNRRKMAVGR
jgi:flagellar biosynthesis protein FlhF